MEELQLLNSQGEDPKLGWLSENYYIILKEDR